MDVGVGHMAKHGTYIDVAHLPCSSLSNTTLIHFLDTPYYIYPIPVSIERQR
jgi:hypothetical protein